MSKTTIKRKKWPAWKYWIEYLRENKGIYLNGQPTISHTLAAALLYRDKCNHSQKEIDRFAEFLDAGRVKAIDKLWKIHEEYYIIGEHKIEIITSDRKYRDEHLARMGHKLDQRRIGAFKKSTNTHANKLKALGLPTKLEIDISLKRLTGKS